MTQLRFEGVDVTGTALSLTGSIDNQVPNLLHIGDQIIMLVVGTVTAVNHKNADNGISRIHTVKLGEAHRLEDGEAGVLLSEARERSEEALDQLLGRSKLDFPGGDEPA